MYSVLFNIENQWVTYTTQLSATDAVQVARMLADLDYEVRIDADANMKEVDYLIGAVQVLEKEAATSRQVDSSIRLFRMQSELLQALLRERAGDIRYITPAPTDVPVAAD